MSSSTGAHGDAIDQSFGVLFGGCDGRGAAVGDRRCDDRGVVGLDLDRRDPAGRSVRELLVQHIERETDRVERGRAPILFRILLRGRVLVRDAIGKAGVVGGEFRRGERGREVGILAALAASRECRSADAQCWWRDRGRPSRCLCRCRRPRSRASIPTLRPFRWHRRRRASRRRGRDDTGAFLLERCRNLHHHRDVELARAIIGVGPTLGARSSLRPRCRRRSHRCWGQRRPVATLHVIDVDERAVVVVDREPAQFRGRQGRRVGDARRRRGGRTCRDPRSECRRHRRSSSW